MEYRKKNNAQLVEYLGIIGLIVFTILSTDLFFRILLAFVAFLLVKDQIDNRNYCLKIDEKGVYEIKGKKVLFIPFEDIELVTVSRKFKKYIAVGNMKDLILIRNSIEDRKSLVKKILKEVKNNKDIYINELVEVALDKFK